MAEIKELSHLKKVNVDGIEYSLQKLPARQALQLRDRWQPDGNVDEIKMFDLVLENIVVHPKVSLDDFEDIVVIEELVKEALNYQYKTKGK